MGNLCLEMKAAREKSEDSRTFTARGAIFYPVYDEYDRRIDVGSLSGISWISRAPH